MEAYISVDELKQHLNVDYEGEETYLAGLIEVSQLSLEKYIHQPLTTFVEDGRLNPMLVHAAKIVAANLYANREPVSFARPVVIPYTLDFLLQPFKKYT